MTTRRNLTRVLVCNASALSEGVLRNIGDEGLTASLCRALDDKGLQVTATLGGYPSGTQQNTAWHSAASRINPGKVIGLAMQVRNSDLVIIGGGTMLANNGSRRWPTDLPRYCFAVALLCKVFRKPLALYGVGAQDWTGGLPSAALRFVVRRSAFVAVRDRSSAELIENSSGVRSDISGDAFFSWKDHPDPTMSGDTVVALNAETNARTISVIAEKLTRGSVDVRVTLVCMDQSGKDLPKLEELRALIVETVPNVRILPYSNNWEDTYTAIASSGLVIASRLHALIFAVDAGVPTVVVATSAKTRAWANDTGAATLEGWASGSVNPSVCDEAIVDDMRARANWAVTRMLGLVG